MTVQSGDTPLPVMSYMGDVAMHPRQINCYITHTNERMRLSVPILTAPPCLVVRLRGWATLLPEY